MLHSPPHARVGVYRDVLPGRRGILLVQAAAKLAGDVGHREDPGEADDDRCQAYERCI